MKKLKILIILGYALLNSVLASAQNKESQFNIFSKIENAKAQSLGIKEDKILSSFIKDSTTISYELVSCNIDYLKNKNFVFSIENEIHSIKDYRIEYRGSNNFSVFANLENGHIYLTVKDNDIKGNIRIGFKFYEMSHLSNGTYIIRRFDQSKYPQGCGTGKAHEKGEDNHNHGNSMPINRTNDLPPNDEPVVNHNKIATNIVESCKLRILVVYTSTAANSSTMSSNPNNFCQHAVDVLNQSFVNSGVIHRAELAYAGLVNYTETRCANADLDRFTSTNDGFMDDVHRLRDLYSADVCILLTTSPWTCVGLDTTVNTGAIKGLARGIYTNSANTFAVVVPKFAVNVYSFLHEIGHLLGARHELKNDPKITPFSCGHGFLQQTRDDCSFGFCNTYFDTDIMAIGIYGTVWSNYHFSRLPYWSNPNININGKPFGTYKDENVVRVLNFTIGDARTFRKPTQSLVVDDPIQRYDFGTLVSENIATSGQVLVDKASVYQAGNSIILNPGFTTNNGIAFTAQIIANPDCSGNPNAGGLPEGEQVFDPNYGKSTSTTSFKLSVFPSPTDGLITMQYYMEKVNTKHQISIYDNLGRKIFSETKRNIDLGVQTSTFEFKNEPEGLYFVKIEAEEVQVEKVLFQNSK
jgi:hypothetical protein